MAEGIEDPCYIQKNWNNMTPDERADAIQGWTQSFLDSHGLGDVDVNVGQTVGETPSGDPNNAEYDPASGSITFDEDIFEDGYRNPDGSVPGPKDFFGLAGHEAFHAMQDEGGDPLDQDEADDFGNDVGNELEGDCDDGDQESGTGTQTPPGDWDLPPGDSAYA